MLHQLITISEDIQSGTPVFFNTRVPVKNLFDYLKANDSLEDFPSVSRDQALAVLAFAENTVTFNYVANEKSTA